MSEELKRSLSFNDLLLFGVAAIMGSGGFNLIGDGIIAGGSHSCKRCDSNLVCDIVNADRRYTDNCIA